MTEASAAARIAGRGIAETTAVVRDTHAAIAKRVFTVTGRGRARPTPTRLMHDGISKGVYAAVGLGAKAAGEIAGVAIDLLDVSASISPVALGALNGAWGDHLDRSGNVLAGKMSIHHNGRVVSLTPEALRSAYENPDGTVPAAVTVWLHGLCETERSWRLGAEKNWSDKPASHAERLQQLTGAAPIFLRYNSGRHISDNGEDLAKLLEALVENWPGELSTITLFGHSMGGLVIRSACAVDAEWTSKVDRIVYLGSPHLGAPLEVGAATVRRWLAKLPETAPLGVALASRSVGIKDLRHGSIQLADWDGLDVEGWLAEPDLCAPLLPSADHYFIGASITASADSVVAKVLGDALVPWQSARGRNGRRDLTLQIDRGRHLGKLHHFDLLNHPRVWAVLEGWFAMDGAAPSAAESR